MANLTKIEFMVLDISGKNYLSWTLDAEMHLNAMGLGETIKEGNETSNQDRAKAMIFIRHHLDEGLKVEYLTVKDPLDLWQNLKERYDHLKTVILPKARYEWMHLRLQDFKSVSEYNSAMFKISSQLKLCGENITDDDMLEKTFSTFHASNMLLQQQYRERGFKKYADLISCLLLAEQNNELLLKNHESRPTGSTPFPEANVVTFNNYGRGRGRGRGRGGYRGRGRHNFKPYSGHGDGKAHDKGKAPENKDDKISESPCHRCGMKGHWARTCRTAKHLVGLYQASLREMKSLEKKSAVEANFINHFDDNLINEPLGMTDLDIADFLNPTDENVNFSFDA